MASRGCLQMPESIKCQATTKAGIRCRTAYVRHTGDYRCAMHTTDPSLAARVQANRVRGGKNKRRQAYTRAHLRKRADKLLGEKSIWDE